MRKISIVAALTLAAAATPAAANLWRLATDGGAAPDRAQYYIDTGSVSRNGDTVKFTTMTVYEGLLATRDYDRSEIQRHGNCATMSSRMLASRFYAGTRLIENTTTPGNWLAHTDGSIAYAMLAVACGKRNYRGTTTSDPVGASRSTFGTGGSNTSTTTSSGSTKSEIKATPSGKLGH